MSDLPVATDTFCGRVNELQLLTDTLDPKKPGQKGIVLCGIGGSGKTQLVLRYIEQQKQSYTAIIWINASTLQNTKQSFAEAANMISRHWPAQDLPPLYAGECNQQKVMARLRTTCYRHWLLVIDSIDDLAQDDFRRYIPSCSYGSAIITSTQDQAAAVFRLPKVEVDRLDAASSRELFLACAYGSLDDANVGEAGRKMALIIMTLMLRPA